MHQTRVSAYHMLLQYNAQAQNTLDLHSSLSIVGMHSPSFTCLIETLDPECSAPRQVLQWAQGGRRTASPAQQLPCGWPESPPADPWRDAHAPPIGAAPEGCSGESRAPPGLWALVHLHSRMSVSVE